MFMRAIWVLAAALLASSASAQTGAAPGSSWQPDLRRPAEFLRALPPRSIFPITGFGARPNDAVDDGPALAAAMTAAQAAGGGAVLIPSGDYLIGTTLPLASDVALIGEGCERSRLVRPATPRGKVMFRLEAARNVRVQGLSFDFKGGPQFSAFFGLRGLGSRNLVFLDNCFDDSRGITDGGPRPDRGDRWAIELSAGAQSRRIWIGRNRSDGGMQLTAGGGGGVDVLRIVDNHVSNGRNAGIAVTYGQNDSRFNDLLIARNTIEYAHGLGVYIGPDKAHARSGHMDNIVIADNIIRGFRGRFPQAIYIRANEGGSHGITVARNRLDAITPGETTAIHFEDSFGEGRRRFTNVLIADNEARKFSRGLWLDRLDGAAVLRNRVSGSRALMISSERNRNVRLER